MAQIITNTSGYRTGGERRFADRLSEKLDDTCVGWYEIPFGNLGAYPDFIMLSPRHGLWVFEVKDWSQKTIASFNKHEFELNTERGVVKEKNPIEQVNGYAHLIVRQLEKDKTLLSASGKLIFPWGVGIVFPNLTRKVFEQIGLDQVIPPDRVICKDEMAEGVPASDFIERLQQMMVFRPTTTLTRDQISHIRAAIYPELRLIVQQDERSPEGPTSGADIIRIMDRQQEQLARSLGSGHRIIHGVAGSGKTMILLFRAQFLAQMAGKPTLILCFNKSLANYLRQIIEHKKLGENVVVQHFHGWCIEQLEKHKIAIVEDPDKDRYQVIADTFIGAIESKQIPAGQYNAILIDEGHDFKPEWLYAAVTMLDMKYNALLLLYDDAQSIYDRTKKRNFSFRSVGIQAQGRATILRLNYRNTVQILSLAAKFAKDLLQPEETDDDGVPILMPESAGREGSWPDIIQKSSLEKQAEYLADCFVSAHRVGVPWGAMAIIYRARPIDRMLLSIFKRQKIPCGEKNEYNVEADVVRFMTMHSCKGLEAALVGIPAIDQMPFKDNLPSEEARLLYVAMTRATRSLIMTYTTEGDFPRRLLEARRVLA
jgi:hypothetical protein